MKKEFLLFSLLFLSFFPSQLSAQTCVTHRDVHLRNGNLVDGMPSRSPVLGFNAEKPAPKAGRDLDRPVQYYNAYVIEKIGDCYKIANSDLRRTMTVSSKSLELLQGSHYQLGLRKVLDDQGQAEAPGKDDCKPEWEVITRKDR